jgi:hypothetical protein
LRTRSGRLVSDARSGSTCERGGDGHCDLTTDVASHPVGAGKRVDDRAFGAVIRTLRSRPSLNGIAAGTTRDPVT